MRESLSTECICVCVYVRVSTAGACSARGLATTHVSAVSSISNFHQRVVLLVKFMSLHTVEVLKVIQLEYYSCLTVYI